MDLVSPNNQTKNELWLLKTGRFFLDPKNAKKISSEFGKWTYQDFDQFLRSLAISLDPEKEEYFLKANFAEVFGFVEAVFTKETAVISANLPSQILLDYLEEQEKKSHGKSQKIRIGEAQKLSALIEGLEEYQLQLSKHKNDFKNFSDIVTEKVSSSPLSPELLKKILPELTFEFAEAIQQTDLPSQTIKLKDLPEEFKKDKEQLITQRWQQLWQETVNRVSENNNFSKEQTNSLAKTGIPVFVSAKIAEEVLKSSTISVLRQDLENKVVETIKTQPNNPLSDQQAQAVAEKIARGITFSIEDLRTNWEGEWKKALNETIVDLQATGQILPEEQLSFIRQVSLPKNETVQIANQQSEVKDSLVRQKEIFEKIVSPVSPETVQKLGNFTQTLFVNLPSCPQIDKLSPEKKQKAVEEFLDQVRATATISLFASLDPESPWSEKELTGIIAKFTSFDEKQLSAITKISQTSPNLRVSLLDPQPISLITQNANKLPKDKEQSFLFRDNTLSSLGTNSVIFSGKQIEKVFLEKGLNLETIKEAKQITVDSRGFILTLKGIKPEDIRNTYENLIKSGKIQSDSPLVAELKQIEESLKLYQLSNIPEEYKTLVKERQGQRWRALQNNNAEPLRIPFSKFRGFIDEVGKINPKLNIISKINSKISTFLGKILGNEKVIFVTQQTALVINKFNFLKQQFTSKISNWFWKTGFGQGLKISLEKAGAKSLEAIFKKFSKEGAKKAVTQAVAKGIASFLVKVGVATTHTIAIASNAIAPVVAFILVEVGAWLLKQGFKLRKQFNKFVLTLGGITNAVLAGISSYSESESDKKQFSWLFIGFFALIFIFPLIFIINLGSAFLGSPKSLGGSGQETQIESCFFLTGPWSDEEKEWERKAINTILQYPKYSQILCKNNEKIVLVRENKNDSCWAPASEGNKIYIRNQCLGNEENSLYALSHETGHIFNRRDNYTLYQDYLKAIGGTNGPKENYLCSYPYAKTYGEDFPETIAVFIMNQHFSNHPYRNCNNRPINLQTDYQLHYNFIKDKL